jgi:hypothetical protein
VITHPRPSIVSAQKSRPRSWASATPSGDKPRSVAIVAISALVGVSKNGQLSRLRAFSSSLKGSYGSLLLGPEMTTTFGFLVPARSNQ